MTDDTVRGRFVWYELMTSDPDAAKAFYTKVVGWGTQPFGEGDPPYTMWMNGEAPVGGFMQLPTEAKAAGAPPHWMPYVGTPDVDATVVQAKDLGAKVLVDPQDIPGAGRFAVLQDPQGAAFACYASDQDAPAPEGPPPVGQFSWHELATSDYEAAFEFYSTLFGWKKTDAMDMGEGAIYQMYGLGEMPLGGIYNQTPDQPGPPGWLLYVKVPSVSDSLEVIKEAGGQVLNGPMDVPGGDQVAQCMDPQGAAFAVHSGG